MKRNTIKWKIFKYNLIVIVILIAMTAVVFNIAFRVYMEADNKRQLDIIANRTEDTVLRKGPDFFPRPDTALVPPPDKPRDKSDKAADSSQNNELFGFYFMLNRSLREPLSVLNADFILLDNSKKVINPLPDEFNEVSEGFLAKVTRELDSLNSSNSRSYLNINYSGIEYMAIVKPVADKNSFGLGYIVIYSSLQKVNQLQLAINIILLVILLVSAIITAVLSSLSSRRITAPFSVLNNHIAAIAERNFEAKITLPVDDELQEFVNTINIMSEKLASHDKAQKTFLQNASHEFRTPLMSIQSYAEGIKYNVVESATTAAEIIISETRRMTRLVEDLLYLSRLDSIEENYHFTDFNYNDFISSCIERMNGISSKSNITINIENIDEEVSIHADEDKLCRAVTNILSNCIRYAQTSITVTTKLLPENKIELCIADDGPGFSPEELPSIFERFYKGKKGNFGLGLAIAKSIITRHNGSISAMNTEEGALFIIELPIN